MGFSFNSIFLMNNSSIKNLGTKVPDLNKVRQIVCGATYIVFLMNDGTVKSVGNNNNGQCCTGNTNTPQLSLYTSKS
jgi:alpha-tubulin suppressor-like RCC1 family protein